MLVSTSAFYAWSKAPESSDKKTLQKEIETKAVQLFEENKKVYGSRRLSEAFIKEDIQVGRFKARQLIKIRLETTLSKTIQSHYRQRS